MAETERRISGEKRRETMDLIIPLQDSDDYKAMCPYCTVKTALCIAALESVMTNRRNCFSVGYKACSIFLVNESRGR